MSILLQLSKNTLKESMREPVFFLILLTALVMIGLFPGMSMFVFRKQIKLVIDSSMATTLLFGLFVAVLSAGHTISREMKNGTVLLLMSKPVTRFAFVISKVLGILAALTVFVLICNCASCISLLVAKDQFRLDNTALFSFFGAIAVSMIYGAARNFFARRSFSSNAIAALTVLFPILTVALYLMRFHSLTNMAPDEFIPVHLLMPALLLLFPAVWVMGAISATLAIRLDFVSNLLICLGIFLTGLVVQYFAFLWLGDSFFASLLGALLPNWQLFWMADALTNFAQIPASYVLWGVVYVLCHIVIWTFWALFLFQDSELARDTR